MNEVARIISTLMPDNIRGADILIMDMAHDGAFLSSLLSENEIDVLCDFYPFAQSWKDFARLVFSASDIVNETVTKNKYDYIFLTAPQNVIATKYKIALALKMLKNGGTLIVAAANDAGGKRLGRLALETGFSAHELQKYKCRAVKINKDSDDIAPSVENWLIKGAPQAILNGLYVSWPGIYGWDKIDNGSALLIDNMPESLDGIGADFGCGYGYLSSKVLSNTNNIEGLHLIDADARALHCAEKNINHEKARFTWGDLSVPLDTNKLPRFDWVVMNPPFHSGKKTDINIGASFIENAARFLKTDAMLYMVANRHLAYEQTLEKHFRKSDTITQKDGFKIIHAKR